MSNTPPAGVCYTQTNTKNFSATIKIKAFVDVKWTKTLSFEGNCNSTPQPITESGSNKVPGGNLSFVLRFSKLGDSYICTNLADYMGKWNNFSQKLASIVEENTKTETKNWPDGKCNKTERYNDSKGCPRTRVVLEDLKRTLEIKQEASSSIEQSITSQKAVCNFT